MALIDIYAKSVTTRYRSKIISKATLYRLISVCLTLISPLLIAYRSGGFWKTTNTYMEQPTVQFKKEILLFANTGSTSNAFIAWGTYTNFNMLLGDNLRIPVVSSYEIDNNGDGRYDQLNITIEIPLDPAEDLVNFQLLLTFDYLLERLPTFQMTSLAYVQHESFTAGASFTGYGDLALVQKTPLYHRGVDLRYNESLVDSSSLQLQEYSLARIFSVYQQRNVTTRYENFYSTWQGGRGASTPFTINLLISYPLSIVTYLPGFWELVKWGWIQYVGCLLVFAVVFDRLNSVVFTNQLFSTVITRPRVKLE